MATLPKSVSESVRKLNPHVYGGYVPDTSDATEPVYAAKIDNRNMFPKPAKKRIRQSSKPLLNKLEAEYFARIKSDYPNYPPIRPQAVKLQLANSVFYKPDFFTMAWPTPDGPAKPTAWEVKGLRGKNVDRGKLALKVAASAWPEIRFVFAWKENGEWCEQIIQP